MTETIDAWPWTLSDTMSALKERDIADLSDGVLMAISQTPLEWSPTRVNQLTIYKQSDLRCRARTELARRRFRDRTRSKERL